VGGGRVVLVELGLGATPCSPTKTARRKAKAACRSASSRAGPTSTGSITGDPSQMVEADRLGEGEAGVDRARRAGRSAAPARAASRQPGRACRVRGDQPVDGGAERGEPRRG
jgi:hypothetical protein